MNTRKRSKDRRARAGTIGAMNTPLPQGSALSPVLAHMHRRGMPVTLANYLAYAGLSRDDVKDAEVRSSLPESIQELLDNEEGPDAAWDVS